MAEFNGGVEVNSQSTTVGKNAVGRDGIVSTPGVSGGEPCIVRTRIPVWLLVRARELGTSEGELLRACPTLRAEDLTNAWAYARAHRAEIQAQIHAHETA
jgi:uncharacterized protein (DUF433 family)